MSGCRRQQRNEAGQTVAEYAVVLTVIIAAIVVTLGALDLMGGDGSKGKGKHHAKPKPHYVTEFYRDGPVRCYHDERLVGSFSCVVVPRG